LSSTPRQLPDGITPQVRDYATKLEEKGQVLAEARSVERLTHGGQCAVLSCQSRRKLP
jgi:hypothetical protein